jgi:pimeloyl-ACP methyl ester carboxylesterase
MRWLKRLVLTLAILVAGVVGLFGASSLAALDWGRAHTQRTSELPLLTTETTKGLVRIEAGGFEFRARVAGLANSGPGLILLHGFPETSAMWTPLIETAAAAGYRVVAFDQRGYSPGARPGGIESYLVPELVGDVMAVAGSAGFERFHLVGHDWGCVVGWSVVAQHPERVLTWSALSIPHPGTMLAELAEEPPAYIQIFSIPWLPEAMLSVGMGYWGESFYSGMPEDQRAEYRDVFLEPGALTATLNWYRAIAASLDSAADTLLVRRPTLFMWGRQEPWVRPDLLSRQRELVDAPYRELELEGGHFVMQEHPQRSVDAIMAQLRSEEPAP